MAPRVLAPLLTPGRGVGREQKGSGGYLCRLLVVGTTAVMRMARKDAARQLWAGQLLTRKPAKIAPAALANKMA